MKAPSINQMINSNDRFDYSTVRLGRTDAIRRHCLDCMCYSKFEVANCADKKCSLWRYRLGAEMNDHLNPKKESTPRQLQALRNSRPKHSTKTPK